MKYAEFCKVGIFCRAGGTWDYEEHLQKTLPIFLFLSNLSLLIVNILRAYN